MAQFQTDSGLLTLGANEFKINNVEYKFIKHFTNYYLDVNKNEHHAFLFLINREGDDLTYIYVGDEIRKFTWLANDEILSLRHETKFYALTQRYFVALPSTSKLNRRMMEEDEFCPSEYFD